MKAAILAGGFGTRLRPLTDRIPKPLVPLLGKPLVTHIIDSLPPQVDTVLLAVNYMRDALDRYFSDLDLSLDVILVEEKRPLGTGGAIKNLSRHLDDTFIAFNGDIISSIDLGELVRFHESKGGIGTLSLWRVDDPSAFGVVSLDGSGRIMRFQEKPSPTEACSDLINAGVYVFEPEILDHIAEGQISMEREVFPRILQEGLYGYRFQGHWVDCGTRENLLLAQRTLLEREGQTVEACQLTKGTRLIVPNHLRGARLEDCILGPYVSADPGVEVRPGAVVSNTLLLPGCRVGRDARVSDSIIGPSAVVEEGVSVRGQILI
jgi:mannose-1-phosphate guanylyltransferase